MGPSQQRTTMIRLRLLSSTRSSSPSGPSTGLSSPSSSPRCSSFTSPSSLSSATIARLTVTVHALVSAFSALLGLLVAWFSSLSTALLAFLVCFLSSLLPFIVPFFFFFLKFSRTEGKKKDARKMSFFFLLFLLFRGFSLWYYEQGSVRALQFFFLSFLFFPENRHAQIMTFVCWERLGKYCYFCFLKIQTEKYNMKMIFLSTLQIIWVSFSDRDGEFPFFIKRKKGWYFLNQLYIISFPVAT